MNQIKLRNFAILSSLFIFAAIMPLSEAFGKNSAETRLIDTEDFKQNLARANKFYAEGVKMKKRGAKKKLYKKPFKEALKIYSNLRKDLYKPIDMRIRLSGEIFKYISGGMYTIDSQFAENIITVETNILPAILYRQAALTLRDITSDDGLFLPPLIRLSKNNFKEYQKALSIPSSPIQGNNNTPVEKIIINGQALKKENFNRISNSLLAQKFYINFKLSNVRKKITEFSDAQSGADLYQLGNAMLLEMFYKRLNEALTSYRKIQEKIQRVAHPPQFIKSIGYMKTIGKAKITSSAIRDRQRFVDATGQKPQNLELPADFDWEDVGVLKKAIKDSLKFAALPLPDNIPEGKAAWKAGRIVEKNIKKSRSLMFAKYRQLVETNRHFNILPISKEIISTFEKAVEMEKNNPSHHLMLGNVYRLLALDILRNQINEANEHFIGTKLSFPKWTYYPKNKKEKIDLSAVNELLNNALNEYKAVLRLSPELGERALGIFYLSLITINPNFAQNALNHLNKAGNDENTLLAKEYAGQLIERAQAEQTHLKFPKEFRDMSDQIKSAYDKLPENSELKPFAKLIMSERTFSEIFAYLTRKNAAKNSTYDIWSNKLEENKTFDSSNPYLSLLQAYLSQRKAMNLGFKATLSAIGESFSLQAQAVSNLNIFDLSGERPSKENFDAYALKKGKKLAKHYKGSYAGNVNIMVKRYKEKDLLKAAEILNNAVEKNPDLALAHFYLGRTYALLSVYYSSQEKHIAEKATINKYNKLAQDTFTQYVILSESE